MVGNRNHIFGGWRIGKLSQIGGRLRGNCRLRGFGKLYMSVCNLFISSFLTIVFRFSNSYSYSVFIQIKKRFLITDYSLTKQGINNHGNA